MLLADTVRHAAMAICMSENSKSSRLCFCGSRKHLQYFQSARALVSHLVSVFFGIFVDFRQGQVGVEFISVFLWYEK